MTWEAMSERERDAWIAMHVMGYRIYSDFPVNAVHTFSPTSTSFKVFRPMVHIPAAMEAEEKIMKKHAEEYATALTVVLEIDGWNITTSAILKLVHASAQDRCRAMFLTLSGKKDTNINLE
jgi:hypothetical protein